MVHARHVMWDVELLKHMGVKESRSVQLEASLVGCSATQRLCNAFAVLQDCMYSQTTCLLLSVSCQTCDTSRPKSYVTYTCNCVM